VSSAAVGLAEGDGPGDAADLVASQLPLPVKPPAHLALQVPVAEATPAASTASCPVLSYSQDIPCTVAFPTTIVMLDPDTDPLPEPGWVTVTSDPDTENSTAPELLPE
jgi:hypothetical protein